MTSQFSRYAVLAGCLLAAGHARAADLPPAAILVCGMEEVFIVDTDHAGGQPLQKLWSWKAADRPELPQAIRRQFTATDDCKPIRNGEQILISSSSAGCALVERATGRALWYASVRAAHSIEMLPGDRILVAASTAQKGDGDRLVLFDVKTSNEPIWTGPLRSAHGVVWDETRQRAWALGFDQLQEYELADWDGPTPSLKLIRSHPLPTEGGHDLQPVPNSNDLALSTHDHVELFDRDARTFRRHPILANATHVKCITFHPVTGRPLMIGATEDQWWTDTIRLLEPERTLKLFDEKIYKARWITTQAGPTTNTGQKRN